MCLWDGVAIPGKDLVSSDLTSFSTTATKLECPRLDKSFDCVILVSAALRYIQRYKDNAYDLQSNLIYYI